METDKAYEMRVRRAFKAAGALLKLERKHGPLRGTYTIWAWDGAWLIDHPEPTATGLTINEAADWLKAQGRLPSLHYDPRL